jgi:Fe-S cluster assembly protein SufD
MFEDYLQSIFDRARLQPDTIVFSSDSIDDSPHSQTYYTKSNNNFKLLDNTTNKAVILATTNLNLEFTLMTQSKLKLFFLSQNSNIDLILNLSGERSELELYVLNILDKDKTNRVHLNINHLKDHTQSKILVKSISSDQSTAILNAQVYIGSELHKIKSNLKLKTLKLSPKSKFTVTPNLRILSKDVECSHASTIATFEKEQIAYLQSRGLSLNEARDFYIQGFLSEIEALLN